MPSTTGWPLYKAIIGSGIPESGEQAALASGLVILRFVLTPTITLALCLYVCQTRPLNGYGRSAALTKQVAAWSPMSFRRNSADSLPAVNHGRMAPQKPGRETEGKSLRGV